LFYNKSLIIHSNAKSSDIIYSYPFGGLLGLSIKLIFDKKAVFKGGCCSESSPELREKGVGECCGGACSSDKP
jgi:hypothetical protein